MRKIEKEEVKRIQLQILEYVQAWCIRNNVKFWLDCGSLLGAIRHKGYIPWDDDIDIGMLRPDYDRFIKEFNQDSTVYKCHCIENNPTFGFPFAKVVDTRTVLYEPDEAGQKLSLNIDVFVYDNAPDDDKLVKKMFRRRNHLFFCRDLKLSKGRSSKLYKSILKKTILLLLHFIKPAYFNCKIVENSKSYSNEQTKRIGNFCAHSTFICDKRVFSDFIWVDFEHLKVKAPMGYDEWLRAIYGEYMELPPVEKRVTHHAYVAYIEDKYCQYE